MPVDDDKTEVLYHEGKTAKDKSKSVVKQKPKRLMTRGSRQTIIGIQEVEKVTDSCTRHSKTIVKLRDVEQVINSMSH